jgi:toxin FitB
MFLVDTNILSELVRPAPDPKVTSWFTSQPDEKLWLSVVTLGEIRRGATLAHQRSAANGQRLENWLTTLRTDFAERLIQVDEAIALRWGVMTAHRPANVIDALLAATAAERGLTVATRNVKDFAQFGVPILNPFDA